MRTLTYSEVVANLEARPIFPDRPPSLDVMHRTLPLVGFLANPSKCILVAGTNGKGSVCATLEALLLSTGARVGLYTSPHLLQTTERIRLQGCDISELHFAQAFEHVEQRTQHWQTEHGILTHFEMLTLMAVWYLSSSALVPEVDWLILEVGLGGTWDATNAVPHQMAVFAQLGLDHQGILGKTIEEIAKNKFGVVHKMQPPMQVVHSPFPAEINQLALEIAQNTNSVWKPSISFESKNTRQLSGITQVLHTAWGNAEIVLAGARGAQNTATALTAFKELGFDPAPHLGALKKVRWLGRMHQGGFPQAKCPVYFSGDHNVQGVQSLVEILKDHPASSFHFVVGLGKDKSFDEMLEVFTNIPKSKLYLTETSFKPRKILDYGEKWLKKAAFCSANPKAALDAAIQNAKASDIVVVTGSLYLVGELMRYSSNRI